MKEHAQVLISPLHDASSNIKRLRTRVCGTEEPWKVAVPVDQLTVHIATIFSSKKGGDGKHVLDLRGNLAELDVLNQG